jgi:murein DD-endopeptidase MepM/ murein hydrolase activator NlpD
VVWHHPYLIGAAALASFNGPSMSDPNRTPLLPGAWIHPVPRWRSYAPVVSSEYGPRGDRFHAGVDIMYRRASKQDRPEFKAGTHDGTIAFFVPPGVPVVACHDALVWEVSPHPTGKGWQVVLDHGKPWASYYLHLQTVNFPPHKRGSLGVRVIAGQELGLMGYDPTEPQQIRHLHFELWYNGAGNAHVNPQAPPVALGGIDHWRIIDLVNPATPVA